MKQRQQNKTAQRCPDETEQRIQSRAFELYSARGQEPGHELEDWLQAEREIRHLGEGAPAHVMGIKD